MNDKCIENVCEDVSNVDHHNFTGYNVWQETIPSVHTKLPVIPEEEQHVFRHIVKDRLDHEFNEEYVVKSNYVDESEIHDKVTEPILNEHSVEPVLSEQNVLKNLPVVENVHVFPENGYLLCGLLEGRTRVRVKY